MRILQIGEGIIHGCSPIMEGFSNANANERWCTYEGSIWDLLILLKLKTFY